MILYMNICISTVYRTENCGSFLQAYALKTYLESIGHNVFFEKINSNEEFNILKKHIFFSAKMLMKLNFSKIKNDINQYRVFKKVQSNFSVISDADKIWDNIDCVIIGSDTLWNIENDFFLKASTKFFGNTHNGKKIISYAVSASNTPQSIFEKNKDILSNLYNFSDISVRDNHTKEIIKNVFNLNCTLTCDPTLLLNQNDFNKLADKSLILDKAPILIYHFGKLPSNTVKQLKEIKEKTGQKIISFGDYRKWCDINIPFSPNSFINCFRDCSFVVTNTFHGTIFSLLYEKNSINYGSDKIKIKELLEFLGACDIIADETKNIKEYYDGKLDFEKIRTNIQNFRNLSADYLKRNIEK